MLQSVRRYLPLLLALLCLGTVIPGLFLSFEDSEIWGITSSRRLIDHPFIGSSAHYKPLFSLMFGTIATIANSDWSALMGSRWLALTFTAGGLFSLYSLGLLCMGASRRFSTTILFYALICTMPLFIVHFPKARSDSISASFILLAGFLILQSEARSTFLRGLIYVCGSAAALLITPKSIDLVAALGVFFWITEYRHDLEGPSVPKSKVFHRLIWLLGPAASLLLIGLIISREFITKSLTYWIDTYQGVSIFSRINWISVERAVVTAPIVSSIIAIGFLAGILGFRRLGMREKALVVIGLIVGGFICIHSQKFFFFLASRIPFLALGALPGLHLIVEWASEKLSFRAAITAVALLFIVSLGLTINRLQDYSGFYLRYQKAAYREIESYLDRTEVVRYWDAIGLFPTRNTIFHYPSPGDRTNEDLLSYVDDSRPTLILRTRKMELLEPFFMGWLRERYVQINDEVYVRSITLKPNENCRYSGSELLLAAKEQMLKSPFTLALKPDLNDPWKRVPFGALQGEAAFSADTLTLQDSSIVLPDCNKEHTRYALTEAKPWDALPAPAFSQFFGYDGTL